MTLNEICVNAYFVMTNQNKNSAQRVYAKFAHITGGLPKAIGVGWSTAQGWRNSGTIPQKYHGQILEAARANEIELSPVEFLSVQLQEHHQKEVAE